MCNVWLDFIGNCFIRVIEIPSYTSLRQLTNQMPKWRGKSAPHLAENQWNVFRTKLSRCPVNWLSGLRIQITSAYGRKNYFSFFNLIILHNSITKWTDENFKWYKIVTSIKIVAKRYRPLRRRNNVDLSLFGASDPVGELQCVRYSCT